DRQRRRSLGVAGASLTLDSADPARALTDAQGAARQTPRAHFARFLLAPRGPARRGVGTGHGDDRPATGGSRGGAPAGGSLPVWRRPGVVLADAKGGVADRRLLQCRVRT